jgi:hypothetical protein
MTAQSPPDAAWLWKIGLSNPEEGGAHWHAILSQSCDEPVPL